PLTETILMGNLALRAWNVKTKNFAGRKKLLWDAVNMKITNFDEANEFVKREYRDGWKMSWG
ncbi:MAG TPA: gfo/Idh/MocA family oxidoreductase, partial [Puia sp.]|nr:gfo/Idh/MocA family oxidoreductase [Puia sp.]